MLWQLAYTEMYVTDVLWPDFGREHLFRAILRLTSGASGGSAASWRPEHGRRGSSRDAHPRPGRGPGHPRSRCGAIYAGRLGAGRAAGAARRADRARALRAWPRARRPRPLAALGPAGAAAIVLARRPRRRDGAGQPRCPGGCSSLLILAVARRGHLVARRGGRAARFPSPSRCSARCTRRCWPSRSSCATCPGVRRRRCTAPALLFAPVLLTWVSDTFAYFGGRALGKRKLIPRGEPREDGGGGAVARWSEPSSVGAAYALVPGAASAPAGAELARGRALRAAGLGRRAGGRPGGVAAQARRGREGLGDAAPRARRRAGPLRLAASSPCRWATPSSASCVGL